MIQMKISNKILLISTSIQYIHAISQVVDSDWHTSITYEALSATDIVYTHHLLGFPYSNRAVTLIKQSHDHEAVPANVLAGLHFWAQEGDIGKTRNGEIGNSAHGNGNTLYVCISN